MSHFLVSFPTPKMESHFDAMGAMALSTQAATLAPKRPRRNPYEHTGSTIGPYQAAGAGLDNDVKLVYARGPLKKHLGQNW